RVAWARLLRLHGQEIETGGDELIPHDGSFHRGLALDVAHAVGRVGAVPFGQRSSLGCVVDAIDLHRPKTPLARHVEEARAARGANGAGGDGPLGDGRLLLLGRDLGGASAQESYSEQRRQPSSSEPNLHAGGFSVRRG